MTALAVTAGTAGAAISLNLGQPDLQAGVLVSVPAAVSCSPWDASLTPASSSISMTVEQAVSKSAVAHGSAELFGGEGSEPLYPCDGDWHTFMVNILADPSGAPFRKGPAVISGTATAAAGRPAAPAGSSGSLPAGEHDPDGAPEVAPDEVQAAARPR